MKTFMLRAAALMLWSVAAFGAPDSTEPIAEVLEDTGVAFIVLTNQDNSIARENRVYQRIVGKLQRQFRKADVLIFNAVIPSEHEPDWSQGTSAIGDVLKKINNPYVDTIVVVTGLVEAGEAEADNSGSEDGIAVSLELQLYDVTSETVYMKLNETALATTGPDCNEVCLMDRVDSRLLDLTDAISSRTIGLISSQHELTEQVAINE